MRKRFMVGLAATALTFGLAAPATAAEPSCWGAASALFAQTGAMGEHSSQQATPRFGLRNLARELADQGLIPDDSMASLGAFVATELGPPFSDLEACQ